VYSVLCNVNNIPECDIAIINIDIKIVSIVTFTHHPSRVAVVVNAAVVILDRDRKSKWVKPTEWER
jgi:hypothetical protein